MKNKRFFVILCLFFGWGIALTAQDVRVSISSREGYVGLPLQYGITITGSKEADIPQLSGFDGFSIAYQGKSQSSQVSIINGTKTSSIKEQFTWQLTPQREGELVIPSQTIVVEGKTFQTPSGTVTIRPPGKVEGFLLKLDGEQKSAYRGQSFLVNMDFYVSREVGNLNFTLPGQSLGSREGEDFLILESRLPDRSGNDIRQIPVGDRTFYGYVSSRIEGGKQYTILTIPLEIMPLTEGSLSLEGAAVSFSLEEGVWPRSTMVSHSLASEPYSFISRELPREIKESTNGILLARGDLKVNARLSADEARPGDPLTFTIELDGIINPEYCEIPPLEDFTNLEESFSLPSSQSRPKVEDGLLTLVQTIRPVSIRSTSVPPIEFVYLNLETNQVSRVSTPSIPLIMSSAGNLSVNDLEAFGEDSQEQSTLMVNDKGIRQNKSVKTIINMGDQRIGQMIGSPLFLLIVFLPPAIYVLLLLFLFIQRLISKKKERDKKNPYKQFLLSCQKDKHLFTALDKYLRAKYFKGKSFTKRELSDLLKGSDSEILYTLYLEGEQSQYAGEETQLDKERVINIVKEQEKNQ